MPKRLVFLGIIAFASGAALLSPLADLLPVDLLLQPDHEPPGHGNRYVVRVASADHDPVGILGMTLLIAGIIVATTGLGTRRRADVRQPTPSPIPPES